MYILRILEVFHRGIKCIVWQGGERGGEGVAPALFIECLYITNAIKHI